MAHVGIFLDRDGTINQEVDYLRSVDELHLLPGAADAIREANQHGWKVIVVTNQSGIARGYLTPQQLDDIHHALREQLGHHGASIDAIYYCPHHPENGTAPYRQECQCRKPNIGMLQQAAQELDIDLTASYVIGDRMLDVQTGINSGSFPILVLTGYGHTELQLCRKNNIPIGFVAEDLAGAIRFIRQHVQHTEHSNC